jgi:hypothetical protein
MFSGCGEFVVIDVPADALSQRALSFVWGHGQRLPSSRAAQCVDSWIGHGVDRALAQRAVEYEQRWGDLYLPPSMFYNGGPKYLGSDVLVGDWSAGGYLEAGPARFSVAYDFLVGPDGVFGVGETEFVPLYASVEGWIESLAIEYLLRCVATEIRTFRNSNVSSLGLSTMSPFPQVPGLADTWLIDDERVVFVCRGIGFLSGYLGDVIAVVYSGIPDRDASLGLC